MGDRSKVLPENVTIPSADDSSPDRLRDTKRRVSRMASEKLKWEAYLHISGTLQIKRLFFESNIDCSSPFVDKYLGVVSADSRDEAISIFADIINAGS